MCVFNCIYTKHTINIHMRTHIIEIGTSSYGLKARDKLVLITRDKRICEYYKRKFDSNGYTGNYTIEPLVPETRENHARR